MIGAMGRLLLAALVAMLAVACASGPKTRKDDGCSAAVPKDGHSLQVYLSVMRGEAKRPLCPGQPLSDKDALWISVELETDAYVRMVFIAPDGQAGELMHQGEADLSRTAEFRAPQGLLAHAPGEAQLFLVASKAPLAQSDETMQLMLDLIRETGTFVDRDGTLHPPENAAPPPEMMQLEASDNLFADFDEKGMAMLAISLQAAH